MYRCAALWRGGTAQGKAGDDALGVVSPAAVLRGDPGQRAGRRSNWVFAAGVTAGIDGALRLAAGLRGDDAARTIQLYMVYAPEPPFDSSTPETAPPAILAQARQSVAGITAQRKATARRVAARLGIDVLEAAP
jgi:hypothetical protein